MALPVNNPLAELAAAGEQYRHDIGPDEFYLGIHPDNRQQHLEEARGVDGIDLDETLPVNGKGHMYIPVEEDINVIEEVHRCARANREVLLREVAFVRDRIDRMNQEFGGNINACNGDIAECAENLAVCTGDLAQCVERMGDDRKGGVKPRQFHGRKDEDAEDWLGLYISYFTFNRRGGANDMRLALGMYLSDSARDWYVDHAIEEIAAWDDVKAEFREYFTKLTPSQKRELSFLQMQKGEEIKAFTGKVSKAFRKLDLTDEAKKAAYLVAVLPIYRLEIEKAIAEEAAEAVITYSDMIKMAMEAKDKLEIYDNASGVSAKEIEAMLNKMTTKLKEDLKGSEEEKEKVTVNEISDRVSRHFDDKFKSYSRDAENRYKKYNSSGGGDKGFKPEGKFQGERSTPLSCFKCGKEGHIKPNCPQIRDQGQGNPRNRRCYCCDKAGHYAKDCQIFLEWRKTHGDLSQEKTKGN